MTTIPPSDRQRIEAQEALAYDAWSEVNRVQLEAYETQGKRVAFRYETAAKVIMVVSQLALFVFIPLTFFTGMPHWVPVVVMLGVGIISGFILSRFQSKATAIREQHKIDVLFRHLMRTEKEVFEGHPHLALSFRLPLTQGSIEPFDVEVLTKDQQTQSELERAVRWQEIKTDPRLWWHAKERKRLTAEAPGSLRETKLRADALGVDLTPSFRRIAAEGERKYDSWREVQAQVRVAKEALEVGNHEGYVKGIEGVGQIIQDGNLLAKVIWGDPNELTEIDIEFRNLCLAAIYQLGGIGALTEAEMSDLEGSPDWAVAFIQTLTGMAADRSSEIKERVNQGLVSWALVAQGQEFYHQTILKGLTENEVLASFELTQEVIQDLHRYHHLFSQEGAISVCLGIQKMIARWESYHSRYLYYRQLLNRNHQLNQINQRTPREPFVQFNRRALEVEILTIKRENYRLSAHVGHLPMQMLHGLKRKLDEAHITAVSNQLKRLTDEQALEVLNTLPCRFEVEHACLRITGSVSPIPLNQAKKILSQVNYLEIDLTLIESRISAPHFREAIAEVHHQFNPLIRRWGETHDRAVNIQIDRLTEEQAFGVLQKLSCLDDIERVRRSTPGMSAKDILKNLNPSKIELEILESYLPEPHFQTALSLIPQNDGTEITAEALAPFTQAVINLTKLVQDNGTTHRQRFWRALTTPLEREAMPQISSPTERAIRRQMQRDDLSIYRTRQYGISLGVSLVALPAIAIAMILVTNIWAQLALTTAYALLPIVVIRQLYGRITHLEKDIDRLRLEEWLHKHPLENNDVQTELNRLGLDLDGTARTVSRLVEGDKFGSEPLAWAPGGARFRGYGLTPSVKPPPREDDPAHREDDPVAIKLYRFIHESDQLYDALLNDPQVAHFMMDVNEQQRAEAHQLILTKEYRGWLTRSQDDDFLPGIIERMRAFALQGEQACLYEGVLFKLSPQVLPPPIEMFLDFVYPALTIEQKIEVNAKRMIPKRWSSNDFAERQIRHIEGLLGRIPREEWPVEQLANSLRFAPEIAQQALSRNITK